LDSSLPITAPDRSRRPAIALADVLALVAGIALVLALPWRHRPEFLRGVGGWSSLPSYPLRLSLVGEALGKLCLALLPVALARCARERRMALPAEFLLACVGLPWLVEGIESLHLLWWLANRFGIVRSDMLSIPMQASMQWQQET
jgi:hypothetical protein